MTSSGPVLSCSGHRPPPTTPTRVFFSLQDLVRCVLFKGHPGGSVPLACLCIEVWRGRGGVSTLSDLLPLLCHFTSSSSAQLLSLSTSSALCQRTCQHSLRSHWLRGPPHHLMSHYEKREPDPPFSLIKRDSELITAAHGPVFTANFHLVCSHPIIHEVLMMGLTLSCLHTSLTACLGYYGHV